MPTRDRAGIASSPIACASWTARRASFTQLHRIVIRYSGATKAGTGSTSLLCDMVVNNLFMSQESRRYLEVRVIAAGHNRRELQCGPHSTHEVPQGRKEGLVR